MKTYAEVVKSGSVMYHNEEGTLVRPRVFTNDRFVDKLTIRHPELNNEAAKYQVDYHEQHKFPDLPPFCVPWYRWSGTAALGLCHKLGATEVHAYGCDMGGFKDFRDRETASRSNERWAQEVLLWQCMVEAMGIKVVRAGIDETLTLRHTN